MAGAAKTLWRHMHVYHHTKPNGSVMQRFPRSDLNDFVPIWERKFDHLVGETEFDRLVGIDKNLLESSGIQDRVGNSCALAQDVFSSLIARQRSVEG